MSGYTSASEMSEREEKIKKEVKTDEYGNVKKEEDRGKTKRLIIIILRKHTYLGAFPTFIGLLESSKESRLDVK